MFKEKKSRRVFFIFIPVIFINWFYAVLIQQQANIIINSWSVLLPFISWIYFIFSFIAIIGFHLRTAWGLGFAYSALLFGAIIASLSYNLAYQAYPSVGLLFVMLLIVDFFTAIYLASWRPKN